MPPRGFKRSRALWDNTKREHGSTTECLASYAKAILYELQPFRLSAPNSPQDFSNLLQECGLVVKNFLTETIPSVIQVSLSSARTAKFQHWMILPTLVGYYYFVRFAHETMMAGPFVVASTVLVLIFTIGLGDDRREGLSAYSMFNRGFERLLGSMDADELVAQHVGGGLMAQPEHEEVDRPLRRHHHHHENDEEDIDNHNHAPEGQARAVGTGGPARRSGKKARRRQNLEQRQEIRRQREAAMAMGFGIGDAEDAVAMNRLIEEQVALHHNQD